jgi:Ca2+:H+ antiporter
LSMTKTQPWRIFRQIDVLLIFIPVSAVLYYSNANYTAVFITAALSIIPLTRLMASSTGVIAARVSNTASALFNATFGNAVELFIAIFALQRGLVDLVKASIVGSILINVLLLVGLSMIAGGLKYKEQRFNKDSAGLSSTMLIIVVIGMALPSVYSMMNHDSQQAMTMSRAVSVILGIMYALSLIYMLVTHKHLFEVQHEIRQPWYERRSPAPAVVILLVATLLVGFESNMLVGTVEPLMEGTGLSEAFIGLVFIALLTNVPEHLSAIGFARKDNMTLSLEIGLNSATQIALFVVPVLVLISISFTKGSLDLVFTPFQLASVLITAIIANAMSPDGICHWLEGAQLVAIYVLIATAFYFV